MIKPDTDIDFSTVINDASEDEQTQIPTKPEKLSEPSSLRACEKVVAELDTALATKDLPTALLHAYELLHSVHLLNATLNQIDYKHYEKKAILYEKVIFEITAQLTLHLEQQNKTSKPDINQIRQNLILRPQNNEKKESAPQPLLSSHIIEAAQRIKDAIIENSTPWQVYSRIQAIGKAISGYNSTDSDNIKTTAKKAIRELVIGPEHKTLPEIVGPDASQEDIIGAYLTAITEIHIYAEPDLRPARVKEYTQTATDLLTETLQEKLSSLSILSSPRLLEEINKLYTPLIAVLNKSSHQIDPFHYDDTLISTIRQKMQEVLKAKIDAYHDSLFAQGKFTQFLKEEVEFAKEHKLITPQTEQKRLEDYRQKVIINKFGDLTSSLTQRDELLKIRDEKDEDVFKVDIDFTDISSQDVARLLQDTPIEMYFTSVKVIDTQQAVDSRTWTEMKQIIATHLSTSTKTLESGQMSIVTDYDQLGKFKTAVAAYKESHQDKKNIIAKCDELLAIVENILSNLAEKMCIIFDSKHNRLEKVDIRNLITQLERLAQNNLLDETMTNKIITKIKYQLAAQPDKKSLPYYVAHLGDLIKNNTQLSGFAEKLKSEIPRPIGVGAALAFLQ